MNQIIHLKNSYKPHKSYLRVMTSFFLALCIGMLPGKAGAETEESKAIDDVRFLGMKLAEQNLNTVRQHLWDIGGFHQARSTVKQRNIDKFFTVSNIRDSYYVEFRYNHKGLVTSARRLYRPYSTLNMNKRSAIQTYDVAQSLKIKLGQPTQVVRKSWAGSKSYRAFIWQSDKMTVMVDREGSEILGNVFVQYTVNRDPFIVEKRQNRQAAATQNPANVNQANAI